MEKNKKIVKICLEKKSKIFLGFIAFNSVFWARENVL